MILNKPKYSDLSMFLTKNRYTGDFDLTRDKNSIKASIKNIILTQKGERPFDRNFGSNIQETLFSTQNNRFVDSIIESSIYSSIMTNESRVDYQNFSVKITRNEESPKSVSIDVNCKLIDSDETITVTITL